MSEVGQLPMPFLSSVDQLKPSVASVFEQAKEMTELLGDDDPIMPSQAALVLKVSKARITELMDLGRLKTVKLGNRRFIRSSSLLALAKSERKGGRPPKAKEMWKASVEGVVDLVNGKS